MQSRFQKQSLSTTKALQTRRLRICNAVAGRCGLEWLSPLGFFSEHAQVFGASFVTWIIYHDRYPRTYDQLLTTAPSK